MSWSPVDGWLRWPIELFMCRASPEKDAGASEFSTRMQKHLISLSKMLMHLNKNLLAWQQKAFQP